MDRASAVELATALAESTASVDAIDVAVCPPSVYLDAVVAATAGSKVAVGAQNMYDQPKGAFTGEISAAMLLDIGCKYVILGHSERRHVLGESDADINKKVVAALEAGLVPIVCVGETLAESDAGRTLDVVSGQLAGSLPDGARGRNTVVAYEPVWAIGTGRTPTEAQIAEVHAHIRAELRARFGAAEAERFRLLYGGSVKPANAAGIFAIAEVDGALVGGASLEAADFSAIISALEQAPAPG